jgi:hypothetical protein
MNYEKAWQFLREEITRYHADLLAESARADDNEVRRTTEGGVAALELVQRAMAGAEEVSEQ